jgi:hypothetical protein
MSATDFIRFTSTVSAEDIRFTGYDWGNGWTFASNAVIELELGFRRKDNKAVKASLKVTCPVTANINLGALMSEIASASWGGNMISRYGGGFQQWYRTKFDITDTYVTVNFTSNGSDEL